MKRFFTSLLCVLAAAATADRPNILFVMSDDHTSQAIGVYGGRLAPLNPTPVIDALAREGVVMENAFCQNAICTPSRANIMTGQSSAVNGVLTLREGLPPERQHLSVEMGRAGYQTAVIGKWHLHDLPTTFDYYKVLPGQGRYFNPVFFETGATGVVKDRTKTYTGASREEGHSSDRIADAALHWLREGRDADRPFFLKLHFKAPHDMFQYAPRYESYLADVEIPEPANMRDRGRHGSIATRGAGGELQAHIGTSIGRRNPRRNYAMPDGRGAWAKQLDPSRTDEQIHGDAYQGYLKAYLRCVKGVDDNLGRVLDHLKAVGLYDNTLIIYTGDQGFFLGEHDYMDKRWAYEEGMRMPFIVRYPASIPAGRSDAIVENIDYAPTMLDFAGVPTPDYMHGESFRAVLETGEEPEGWKTAAYYHYWMHMASHDNPGHIAIRTKRNKLILFYGAPLGSAEPETPPAWELYDLEIDPTEDHNVYGEPAYDDVTAELKQMLKQRRAELGEDDPKFAINAAIDAFWDYGPEQYDRAVEISGDYLKLRERRAEDGAKGPG